MKKIFLLLILSALATSFFAQSNSVVQLDTLPVFDRKVHIEGYSVVTDCCGYYRSDGGEWVRVSMSSDFAEWLDDEGRKTGVDEPIFRQGKVAISTSDTSALINLGGTVRNALEYNYMSNVNPDHAVNLLMSATNNVAVNSDGTDNLVYRFLVNGNSNGTNRNTLCPSFGLALESRFVNASLNQNRPVVEFHHSLRTIENFEHRPITIYMGHSEADNYSTIGFQNNQYFYANFQGDSFHQEDLIAKTHIYSDTMLFSFLAPHGYSVGIANSVGNLMQVLKVNSNDDIQIGGVNGKSIYLPNNSITFAGEASIVTENSVNAILIGTLSKPVNGMYLYGAGQRVMRFQNTINTQGYDIDLSTVAFNLKDRSNGQNVFEIWKGAPGNSLVVRSDGRVGIGTENPSLQLEVEGSIDAGGFIRFSTQYPPDGAGVPNGSKFYATDGQFYKKNGAGIVTPD